MYITETLMKNIEQHFYFIKARVKLENFVQCDLAFFWT